MISCCFVSRVQTACWWFRNWSLAHVSCMSLHDTGGHCKLLCARRLTFWTQKKRTTLLVVLEAFLFCQTAMTARETAIQSLTSGSCLPSYSQPYSLSGHDCCLSSSVRPCMHDLILPHYRCGWPSCLQGNLMHVWFSLSSVYGTIEKKKKGETLPRARRAHHAHVSDLSCMRQA